MFINYKNRSKYVPNPLPTSINTNRQAEKVEDLCYSITNATIFLRLLQYGEVILTFLILTYHWYLFIIFYFSRKKSSNEL